MTSLKNVPLEQFEIFIDDERLSFTLQNELKFGSDEILADREHDILERAGWYKDGFTVEPIFTPAEFDQLQRAITSRVREILTNEGASLPTDFSLDQYHRYVDGGYGLHQKVIEQTRDLTFEDLNFDFLPAVRRISETCATNLSEINPVLKKSFIIVRISRPMTEDYNPPHKDGYLEVWERTVNLWVPIAGCDRNSALSVVRGSHLWPESKIKRTQEGAMMNGRKYHVPAIVEWNGSNRMSRVDPKPTEMLIFSPLLIHGCAKNLNADKTRVSLELRLSAVDKAK